ncbi:MAG: S9 family peptidase [Chloroflexi bacterium]|nr:S9 family peptidase [Chloroflexota bacterium]
MPRRFAPEDLLRIRSLFDPQISPDGRAIAFVSGDSFTSSGKVATKFPKSRINIIADDGRSSRELTSGPRADSAPRWSPDGTRLAFLSDRDKDGQRQVFVLPMSGGEAKRITSVEGSIPSPRSLNPLKWLSDGTKLAFLLIDAEPPEEKERKESGDDGADFENRPKHQRLWTVDINTCETECVSPDGLQVWEFDISSDGARAAAVVSDQPYEWDWYRSRIAVFEPGQGAARTIYQSSRQVAKPACSPDGKSIAFLSSTWSDRGVDAGDILVIPAGGGAPRNLTEGHQASHDSIRWLSDTEILAGANVDGGSGLAKIDAVSGKSRWLWQAREALGAWSVTPDGTALAAVIGKLDRVREIYAARETKGALAWQRLTDNQSALSDIELPTVTEIQWRARDGLMLRGFLALPAAARNGPLPAVLLVHGGPTSACRASLEDCGRWALPLAGAGLAVFMPNYRGSTGRGVAFAELNLGDMGGKDFQDMLAGIDHLVAEGIADPDRLGVGGWSYGGFTTMWAVTQTDRFKAAVAGAGISDWRSFHGKSYLHTWDTMHYAGADPYDPEGPHVRFSPINYVKRVRAPTLILHGEEDGDVPVEQSFLFHRALKDLAVETQLVTYPREPHGPHEYRHVLDILTRTVEWFERKLKK